MSNKISETNKTIAAVFKDGVMKGVAGDDDIIIEELNRNLEYGRRRCKELMKEIESWQGWVKEHIDNRDKA